MINDQKVTVKIYNLEISLDSKGKDPLYINALARYVDEQMHRIANSSSTVASAKVAVLTALNIADELFSLRDKKENKKEKEHIERIIHRLEEALK